MRTNLLLAAAAALLAATPALAVTNLIKNGSFEAAGTTGPNAFTNWVKTNNPPNERAIVINYNSAASYANGGASRESVGPDNIANSPSPDAVGSRAAYFVANQAVNETLSQLTYLGIGNYRVGFSYYLPANGLRNRNNASLDATILGTPVASTAITATSPGQTWLYASRVAQITKTGFYPTALVFNSNGNPAKDIVVDRVFAIRTRDVADVVVPETTMLSVPEPTSWAMMLAGFGLIGLGMRRRPPTALAA